jgi:DNA-binding NarL/FixJ family response regulator
VVSGDDGSQAAVVDLGLRRQDAIQVIEGLVAAQVPVIAVGQHEDLALRKRALSAGAARVYSYDKLFRDGPDVIRRWLDGIPGLDR